MLKKMQVDVQIPDDFYSEAVKTEISTLKTENAKLKKKIKSLELKAAADKNNSTEIDNRLAYIQMREKQFKELKELAMNFLDVREFVEEEMRDERY